MMKKSFLSIVCLLLWAISSSAARIDTLMVPSHSMKREVQVLVVIPDIALGNQPVACPTLYMLHGHGNNAYCWPNLKPDLRQIADQRGMIFVCPDGKASWYWDSPRDSTCRYETFISLELISYIDKHYATITDRKGRAITGLSMGGHGAMWNAIRHKEVFGAVGSTSGGMDIRPFPKSWNMAAQLGDYETNRAVWDAHTVINQIDKLHNGDLAIIIDCGVDDFFLDVNLNMNERLLARKIDHDFIVRPGDHSGKYWSNSIDYQILFFDKFFRKK